MERGESSAERLRLEPMAASIVYISLEIGGSYSGMGKRWQCVLLGAVGWRTKGKARRDERVVMMMMMQSG
jgi:hypothetical protein